LQPAGFARLRRLHAPLLAATVVPQQAEYGADVLLDAFARVRARLPSAGLVIYGPGTRTPALAADGVHLLGELDRARALGVVAGADLFVRPSRADGDALSVREAIALGRPVVASAVGQRPPEALLFPAGDAAACAEKIFHALGNRREPIVPASALSPGCLPALLAIYRRCGLTVAAATNGTALATLG
jgi:glycosyltransferase involved in cell wall biosynthesis